MADAIHIYLPWLLSLTTIYSAWLTCGVSRHARLVGLTNQALWLIWILSDQAWGFLPMNAVWCVLYMRKGMLPA
jgi:hypothetical protein